MPEDADKILENTKPAHERVKPDLRKAADFFHENEGELFERTEAAERLKQEFDFDEFRVQIILSELVGDEVDPIIQIPRSNKRYVGIVKFIEFEGAYGYVEYDDRLGKQRKVVCQQCVNDSKLDEAVTHATAGDPSGSFESTASFQELLGAIHDHYDSSHEEKPEEIETGASLASGTTISSSTSWHDGNVSGGTDISVSSTSVSHANTSSQGDVNTSGGTIIDNVSVDGRGHVNSMGTRNPNVDDWNNATNASNNNLDADKVDGNDASALSSTGQAIQPPGWASLVYNNTNYPRLKTTYYRLGLTSYTITTTTGLYNKYATSTQVGNGTYVQTPYYAFFNEYFRALASGDTIQGTHYISIGNYNRTRGFSVFNTGYYQHYYGLVPRDLNSPISVTGSWKGTTYSNKPRGEIWLYMYIIYPKEREYYTITSTTTTT